MVCDTVKPNLRAASCCRVLVVKGAAGLFFIGLVTMSSTTNVAPLARFKKASASSRVLNRLSSSAFSSDAFPSLSVTWKSAVTRYEASLWNCWISRSRSTIRRTATDCTRPADKAGFTLRQSTGESLNPTIRSNTRRACWAFTRLMSMLRGFSMACRMAFLVISWKTMRRVFSGFSPNTSNRCHEMASPSRSSSEANHTISAFLASAFSSFTNFFLSAGIS